jgi:hypothetical protein
MFRFATALFALSAVSLLVPMEADAGATASTFKPEHRRGANYYNAQSAIDGDVKTVWQVPGDSPNLGEWIMIDVPKATVEKVGIYVGWVESEERFTDYPRLKEVRIEGFTLGDTRELEPAGTATASFEDNMEWQIVDIEKLAVGSEFSGGKIKISVVGLFKGEDYPNLAVSEVILYLEEYDTPVSLLAASDAVDGKVRESMRDDNAKSYFLTNTQGATLQVESESHGLSSIGVQAGPSDKGRPKTIKVTANNRSATYTMENNSKMQWFDIPTITGYSGGAFGEVDVHVIDCHGGSATVGIAEVAAKATNYGGF